MVYVLNRLCRFLLQRLLTQYRWEEGKVIRDKTIEKGTFYPNSKQSLMPPWLPRLRQP